MTIRGTWQASVQYGDWSGTAAADDSDHTSARAQLRNLKDMKGGEMLIGIKAYHSASIEPGDTAPPETISVTFVLGTVNSVQDLEGKLESNGGEMITRIVRREMPIVEFFALFKRFHVVLSMKGVLDGAEVHERDA